jgi:hypothetical protein
MSERLFPARRVLWMPLDFDWQAPTPSASHCCEEMVAALEFACDQHDDPFDCPDTMLVYHEPFEEYGIPVRDGGPSYLVISNCPFCGARLPESGREGWFDETEAAGHEGTPFKDLPEKYQTAAWRKH